MYDRLKPPMHRCWRKAKPRAATCNRKNHGLPTRGGSRGKTFFTFGESTDYGGNALAISSNPGQPVGLSGTAAGCCPPAALAPLPKPACRCGLAE